LTFLITFNFIFLITFVFRRVAAHACMMSTDLSATPPSTAGVPHAPPKKASAAKSKVPVTVFTGFLGAGKTTVLLNLIGDVQAANANYKIAFLKNELGDTTVDSVLASLKGASNTNAADSASASSSLLSSLSSSSASSLPSPSATPSSAVTVVELLNGCLCCTLVGALGDALEELVATHAPDRIVVETSGTAFPAPLAMHIRRLSEAGAPFSLDAVVCVVDARNFAGYGDTSVTAKMQARFTDLILLNKCETATDVQIDRALDCIYELNPDTAVVRTTCGRVSADLLLSVDSTLFAAGAPLLTAAAVAAPSTCAAAGHEHTQACGGGGGGGAGGDEHPEEVDLVSVARSPGRALSRTRLEAWLTSLSVTSYYRVKGTLLLVDEDVADAADATDATAVANADAAVVDATVATSADAGADDAASVNVDSESVDASSSDKRGKADVRVAIVNFAFGQWRLTDVPLQPDSHSSSEDVVAAAGAGASASHANTLRCKLIVMGVGITRKKALSSIRTALALDDGPDGGDEVTVLHRRR
jgi:G3E family GTPase